MIAPTSPVADDVARIAVRRGVVVSELRGTRGEWLRSQLTAAAGANVLDDLEWAQVMRRVAEATEKVARTHAHAYSVCRSCGQPVWWAETVSGKRMPLDPLPTRAGNVVMRPFGSKVLAVVHGKPDLPLPESQTAYRAHAATCPRSPSSGTAPAAARAKDRPRCAVCGLLMDQTMWDAGERTHPTCGSRP